MSELDKLNENSEISHEIDESIIDNESFDEINKKNIKMKEIIKSISDSRFAEIFRYPVDIERDNVPDYYDIIQNPMDLSTIMNKIENNLYHDYSDMTNDFRLMLSNCQIYNPEGSVAYHHGKELEKLYNRKISKITSDTPLQIIATKRKSSHHSSSPLQLLQTSSQSSMTKNIDNKSDKAYKTSSKIKKNEQSVISVPRESSRISKKSILAGQVVMEKEQNALISSKMNYCIQVINELLNKRHSEYSFHFISPVDPIVLGIPDYFTIIKYPIDLGTIRDKLKSNHYQFPYQFVRDVRLVFTNCFRYNSLDSDVYTHARKLQNVFEHMIATCPIEMFYDFHVCENSEEYSTSNIMTRTTRRSNQVVENKQIIDTIQNLDKKMQLVLEEVQKIKNDKSKITIVENGQQSSTITSTHKRPLLKSSTLTTPIKSGVLSSSLATPTTSSIRTEPDKIEECDPMTYDEKLLLSTQIMSMGENRIKEILSIINQKEPWSRKLSQDKNHTKDSVEFDLDALAPSTLRAIEKYIHHVNKKKMESIPRKKCTPEERMNRENDLRKKLEDMESQLSGKAPIIISKKNSTNYDKTLGDEGYNNRLSDSSSSSEISDDEFAKRYSLKQSSNTTILKNPISNMMNNQSKTSVITQKPISSVNTTKISNNNINTSIISSTISNSAISSQKKISCKEINKDNNNILEMIRINDQNSNQQAQDSSHTVS